MVLCSSLTAAGALCRREAVYRDKCSLHASDEDVFVQNATIDAFEVLTVTLGRDVIRELILGKKGYVDTFQLLPDIHARELDVWLTAPSPLKRAQSSDTFKAFMSKLTSDKCCFGTLVEPTERAESHYIGAVYLAGFGARPATIYIYDPARPCGPGYYTADTTIDAIYAYCEGVCRVLPIVDTHSCQSSRKRGKRGVVDVYCQTWSLRFLELAKNQILSEQEPHFPDEMKFGGDYSKSEDYILKVLKYYASAISEVSFTRKLPYYEDTYVKAYKSTVPAEYKRLDPVKLVTSALQLP